MEQHEKIAASGRCGHLADRGDKNYCDGETRERNIQMTFVIERAPLLSGVGRALWVNSEGLGPMSIPSELGHLELPK